MTYKKPTTRRGERAIQSLQEAAVADTMPCREVGDDVVYRGQADLARAEAERFLEAPADLRVVCGEALTHENKADEPFLGAHARIIDTLAEPNTVAIGASQRRTSAVAELGMLEAAVDAAESARAANSLEKMLCHQMTAAHFTALRLLERAGADRLPPADIVRLSNAAARMMDVYQTGCLTLQKLKAHGQQRVLVQYQQVNVGSGGQALVASRIGRGSGNKGRRAKNG